MESIYWVLTWACHRKCAHCYDDRFRPYVRDALERVVGEGQAVYRRIIANLPDDMTFAPAPPGEAHTSPRKRTTLILAGGELLIDGVREELFYPALAEIAALKPDAVFVLSSAITGLGVWEPDRDALLAQIDRLNPVDPATGRRAAVIRTVQFHEPDPAEILRAIAQAHGGSSGADAYTFIPRLETEPSTP